MDSENIEKDKGKLSKYLINKKPIKFYWPKYIPPFSYGMSSVYTKDLHEKCEKSFLEYCKIKKDPVGSSKDIGFWGAFTYPNCKDPVKMEVLAKLFWFQFWLDDQTENYWGDVERDSNKAKIIFGQLIEVLDKLLGAENISAHQWKPYIVGQYDCIGRIFSEYNSIQKKRFVDLMKLYCYGNIDESEIFDGSKNIESVDQLIWQRTCNSGVMHCAQLIEYVYGLELTEDEWQNPLLQSFIKTGTKSIILTNDLFSFRKEIVECNGDFKHCRNMIILYMDIEKISLQEAVNKLIDEIKEADNEVKRIGTELKSKKSVSNDINRFIDEFYYIISGSWLCQLGLKRYHGKNFKGIVPLSGQFIFCENETIIIPDKYNEKFDFLKKFYE